MVGNKKQEKEGEGEEGEKDHKVFSHNYGHATSELVFFFIVVVVVYLQVCVVADAEIYMYSSDL